MITQYIEERDNSQCENVCQKKAENSFKRDKNSIILQLKLRSIKLLP